MMGRRGLAALLIALLTVPAVANGNTASPVVAAPIGTFSYSNSTMIAGARALAGTTVFSGDMIEVGKRGSAWILLNSGMKVRVSAETRLRLKELAGANQVEMEMFSGAAQFRTSKAAPVVARLADATVRANGANPAVGIISVLSRNKAIIGAEKGELLVSTAHDGKSISLRQGQTVELTLETVPESAQSDPSDKKKGNGTGAPKLSGPQVAIIGVLLAGSVMLIGFTVADNNELTDAQKQNLVSPFKFP